MWTRGKGFCNDSGVTLEQFDGLVDMAVLVFLVEVLNAREFLGLRV